jgi:glycosyltransferase involved in cell wall biosynthesis
VATARAVVIPSVSDISPNLALEALASGTPVILTRYSGYPWGRESGVLRVEPDDTASLREALHEVAETASYERLRKNAEKFRCPFGKQEWQAAYDSLIRNTL